MVSTTLLLAQLCLYLNLNVEEDLLRAQEESCIPDVAISGLLEKLPVKVPVVLSFCGGWALTSEEPNGHHDLFLQNS